jgi:hypothetical protein
MRRARSFERQGYDGQQAGYGSQKAGGGYGYGDRNGQYPHDGPHYAQSPQQNGAAIHSKPDWQQELQWPPQRLKQLW